MVEPNWKGLFEWSMKYQDGTSSVQTKEAMNPEDRAWLEEAMRHHTIDVGQRMQQIKQKLDDKTESSVAIQEKEQVLDELVAIVEDIDYAKDLTTIGGLNTLMSLLADPHETIRWRAAEVSAVSMQNNPPVQEWFMQGEALPKLMKLTNDKDAICRQKALLAISGLIRQNSHGLHQFLLMGGTQRLQAILREDQYPRTQRKAVQLLEYIARESPQQFCCADILPDLRPTLKSSNTDLREDALSLLVTFSCNDDWLRCLKQDAELKELLRLRSEDSSAKSAEYSDELHLIEKLTAALQGPISTSRVENGRLGPISGQNFPEYKTSVLALTGP